MQKERKIMSISYDLDGTLFDPLPIIRFAIKIECGGYDIFTDRKEHAINVPYGDTGFYPDAAIHELIRKVLEYGNEFIPLYPDALSALNLIHSHIFPGKPVIIVTAREPSLQAVTEQLVKRDIHLSSEIYFRSTREKKSFLEWRGTTIWVDDRLKTANEISEAMKITYLLNRPWNEGRETAEKVVRVNTLMDVFFHLAKFYIYKGEKDG